MAVVLVNDIADQSKLLALNVGEAEVADQPAPARLEVVQVAEDQGFDLCRAEQRSGSGTRSGCSGADPSCSVAISLFPWRPCERYR